MIYVLVVLLGIASSVRGKYLEECERSSSSPNGQDVSLTCRLRTINSEFDKTNFSAISGDSVVSLQLQCSDVLFYQSSLQPGSLSHFSRLSSLHIEHCKLSRLPPSVFAGLSLLKNLTIRTHNTAWPVLSLDIASGVFTQLPHLEKVDISANNIWTFPDRLFCPALSLEHLNVSLNRLQDISDLGFRERDDNRENSPFGAGGPGVSREPGCKLGVQVLDLSYNRLILLPPRGLGTLNSLKELYLQGNEISVVADRALSGLKGLRVLNLADNKVVALPETLLSDSTEISEIYLQNNSLSSLPPKLLAKLNQLVVLDLSHNILTSNWMMKGGSRGSLPKSPLSTNDISGTNNETHTTSQPASSATTSTASTTTTIKTTTTTAASTKSQGGEGAAPGIFSGLIRLVLLNLGYNRLTRLSPEPFQDLYSLQILNVEHNAIDTIEPNTFSAMNNLHTLILSHNKLTFIDATALNGLFVLSLLSLDNNALTGIHPSAFHNCTSLKDLNLNGNSFGEIPLAIQNLTLLKTVDLGENQIEQLEAPRLIGLPNLYGLRVTGNRVANVSKEDLRELPSLKVLNLARNRLQYVEKGSFDSNTNLQAVRLDSNFLTDISNLFAESPNLIWLNISDNHLTWFDFALIPKQLQWLDIHKNGIADLGNYFQTNDLRLQTLDASFNRITKIGPSNIPDSLEMLYLNDNLISTVEPHTFYKKVNLSRVDIFANQIETMDFKAMQLAPYPEGKALPEFYIGGNPIVCDCNMEWLQRLNKLDHLRQHPKVMDLDSVYCKLVYNRDKYYVPLAEADPSQFLCSYKTHCFALCHCCDFDACDCEMTCPNNCTCYHDDTWSANIVDCAAKEHTSVPARIPMDSTEVYLDGNHFEELTSHVFIGRKNLKVLYLNNSRIERLQNNSFSGLNRLQILHLENNFLTELRGYEFGPLGSLRELYLQSNQISFIANNTFASLRVLEVLKLDGNRLTRFTMWSLSLNPYLVEIALNDNPWSCDCDYVSQAAPWIQSNVAKLMDAQGVNCRLNGKSLSLVYMNGTKCSEITALSGAVEAPESSLPPYVPLLVVIMAITLLIGTVFVAVCRKRTSLRIWAVAKCPLNHCYQTTLDDDREKLYDAYVAYSVKDESWVSQVFANELQQSCDNPYRLCLHYKDFPVTSYIADTIVEAVESSRRTVIVLSKNFIQSEWCRFEFKSALHAALRGKKNRLVAITLGDLPTRDLDPDLRVCLRSATVLSANDKLFWAKLRCALPNPRASFNNSNSSRTLTRPGSGSSVTSSVSNTYNCSQGGGSTLPLNVSGSVGVVTNHNSNTLMSNGGGGSHHLNHHHQTLLHHHQQQQYHDQFHHNNVNSNNSTGSNGSGTLPHLHSNSAVSVPLFVPPFPPPNRPPPPFPAPRRPPPPAPAPLWA
jgi:Leucine-rich repeat (LRR) protein